MRKTILILASTAASGLLFVNVYNSIVDAPNWGRDIPASLYAAHEYFKAANPGTFFRAVSPANQLIAVLALIVCWRADTRVRIYCAAAIVCAVAGEILTFAYFYPRNAIMFNAPLDQSIEALEAAWSGWSAMNWVRSAIIAGQVVFDFLALMLVAKFR